MTSPARPQLSARCAWALLGVIWLSFLSVGLAGVLANPRPGNDQEYYLELALNLRERHSFVQSGMNPFRPQDGLEHPHANRSPLYPALLAPLASRSSAFFWRAKLFNVLLCSLVLPALFACCHRTWGTWPSLAAALLLSLNSSLLLQASCVMVDGFLVLLLFLTLWSVERALVAGRGYALVGLLLGLFVWTKGSYVLLIPPLALGLLLADEARFVRSLRARLLGCGRMLLVALVIAAPWLWRNWVSFRSPLYNVNSHTFWLEGWDLPDDGFYIPRPPGAMPSARAYLATHTLQQNCRRLGEGLTTIIRRLDEILGVKSPRRLRLDHLTGLLLLLLAVGGIWTDKVPGRRLFMGATLAMFVLFHAWYNPIAGPTRFLAVLAPYLLLYAGRYASGALGACARSALRAPAVVRGAVLAGAVALVALGQLEAWRGADRGLWGGAMSPEDQALLARLQQVTQEREAVVTQPMHGFPWLWVINRRDQWLPAYSNMARITQFLRQWGIRWVVLSPELWEIRRYVLRAYVICPDGRSLVPLRDPPGWELVPPERTRQASSASYLLYHITDGPVGRQGEPPGDPWRPPGWSPGGRPEDRMRPPGDQRPRPRDRRRISQVGGM